MSDTTILLKGKDQITNTIRSGYRITRTYSFNVPAFADVEFARKFTNDVSRRIVRSEMNHLDSIFVFGRLAKTGRKFEKNRQVTASNYSVAIGINL